MELLAELDQMNNEREQFLLMEKSAALMFLRLQRIAEVLTKGGVVCSIENLSKYGFLPAKAVESTIKWFMTGRKGAVLPFDMEKPAPTESELATLMTGFLWFESRSKNKRDGRPIPPEDTAVVGLQRLMDLTGIPRPDILRLTQENQAAIEAEFPDFMPAWVKDTKDVVQNNYKNQHPDTKLKLIRQAVVDIAQGRLGMVTSEQLEKWQGGRIGYGARQIDNLLSNNKELFDLDKYRAYGRSTMRPTDKDRAAAYERSRTA